MTNNLAPPEKRPKKPDVSRRAVLGAAAGLGITAGLGPIGAKGAPGLRFKADPFSLGVASGDPLPDGVVLWTRLAPDPLAADGGMEPVSVSVRWQVAEDERFGRVVGGGTVTAGPASAHSVHVEVSGLKSGHRYFYRFVAGGVASPVGRTQTAPAPGTKVRLRFGQCGCQHYETGFYTAYARMVEDDLDFVFHSGDYIYEKGSKNPKKNKLVRYHPDVVCTTLKDYRRRYGLYKSDPDLKAAHAAFPFIVTFDDHEVAGNFAGDIDAYESPRAQFLARRAAAFQAYYEHMPLRRAQRPMGPNLRLYRAFSWGNLLRFHALDTRSYRSDQPCGGGTVERCPGDSAASATMLGATQEAWLKDALSRFKSPWNVLAQQVPMAELDRDKDPGLARYAMDKWDGYRVPRARLLRFLGTARIANPVVLSGDIHRHMAADLIVEGGGRGPVASEFVNSSISSRGDGVDINRRYRAWLNDNPHFQYISALRGYVRHIVDERRWQADFRVLDRVTVRGAAARTGATFVIEAGRPGLTRG
jgi:alkaline phosphatase D